MEYTQLFDNKVNINQNNNINNVNNFSSKEFNIRGFSDNQVDYESNNKVEQDDYNYTYRDDIEKMSGYESENGNSAVNVLEMYTSNGNIQLGYDEISKKIVFKTEKSDLDGKIKGFSYQKKFEQAHAKQIQKKYGGKDSFTQYKSNEKNESATAVFLDKDMPNIKIANGFKSAYISHDGKKSSLGNVMKQIDFYSENNRKRNLINQKKSMQVHCEKSEKYLEQKIDIAEKTAEKRQQDSFKYYNIMNKAINKIKFGIANSKNSDLFIEFIKKKSNDESANVNLDGIDEETSDISE